MLEFRCCVNVPEGLIRLLRDACAPIVDEAVLYDAQLPARLASVWFLVFLERDTHAAKLGQRHLTLRGMSDMPDDVEGVLKSIRAMVA